jgi:hypothetical protein
LGRITRRPRQTRAKLEHECRVGTGGDKWRTHQGELWAAASRIAGAAGWRKTSRFWAFVSLWFDSAEKAAALKAWLQAEQFGHHQASFVPRPEPTAEDIASDRWLAEEWGFATGKVGMWCRPIGAPARTAPPTCPRTTPRRRWCGPIGQS